MFEPTSRQMTDYGGFHQSSGIYWRFAPLDVASLWAGLSEVKARGMAVRVRGAGHSMNGSSIPRSGEVLIETKGLDSYVFTRPGAITVGAGATMWDVQRLLEPLGHELLVLNDGNAPASTVGGYVSAGGFGAESWRHGGFWESVESIDIVTLEGAVRTVGSADPLFPWLFGSMGQLCIIVSATLVVRPRAGVDAPFPLGKRGRVPVSRHNWEKTIWFSAFVPRPSWVQARRELAAIGDRHAHLWQARPGFAYSLPFTRFTPPLIHPAQRDLVAVGIWGEAPAGGFDHAAVRALDAEFTLWLRAHPDFRRYAQTELLYPGFDIAAHFGPECVARFREWKNQLDPSGRLAPGLLDLPAQRESA